MQGMLNSRGARRRVAAAVVLLLCVCLGFVFVPCVGATVLYGGHFSVSGLSNGAVTESNSTFIDPVNYDGGASIYNVTYLRCVLNFNNSEFQETDSVVAWFRNDNGTGFGFIYGNCSGAINLGLYIYDGGVQVYDPLLFNGSYNGHEVVVLTLTTLLFGPAFAGFGWNVTVNGVSVFNSSSSGYVNCSSGVFVDGLPTVEEVVFNDGGNGGAPITGSVDLYWYTSSFDEMGFAMNDMFALMTGILPMIIQIAVYSAIFSLIGALMASLRKVFHFG